MSRVFQSRLPGAQFDIVYTDGIPEVFGDGVADVMFQGSHVRLAVFQNRPLDLTKPPQSDGAFEHREVALFLTMPVAQFVESFSNILRGVAENYNTSQSLLAQQNARLVLNLDEITRSGIGRPSIMNWTKPEDVQHPMPTGVEDGPASATPRPKPRPKRK